MSFDLETRFWDKVDCGTVDECWIWMAGHDRDGYGKFGYNGQITNAHRVAYILEIGAIPNDKEIHHMCENPKCVNPHHLVALTDKEHLRVTENTADKRNARKTHCKRGHEFTPENTIQYKNGYRQCKECHKEDSRRSHRIQYWKKRRGKK